MTIATKNNAIILKDGKLAENCGCCGGWYCDAVACFQCNLGVWPPRCLQTWNQACASSLDCKTMIGGPVCQGSPLSVSVSGFSADGFFSEENWNDLRNTFTDNFVDLWRTGFGEWKPVELSRFNKQYAVSELCGFSTVSAALPSVDPAKFRGGGLQIQAGYSRSSPSSGLICGSGNAALQLRLVAGLQYGSRRDNGTYSDFTMLGAHTGPCVLIDSLPQNGSFLSGKSITLNATGTMTNRTHSSYSATQTITVSFA